MSAQTTTDTSILDPRVRAALEENAIQFETLTCQPEFADTAEFCEHYGVPAGQTCNTIVVVIKTTPRQYVACLVRSDTRLDVNHRVASAVGFKRLSFASGEETATLTGMLIGGVTLLGLPRDMPVIIDASVMQHPWIIAGGGNRSSKVRLDPRELLKIPNSRVEDVAIPRTE